MINDEQRKMIQQEVLTALGSCPPLDMIQDSGEIVRFDEREKGSGNKNCWLCVYPYTRRLYWTRGNNRLRENNWGHASETGESKTWTPEEWREFKQQEQERKEKKEKELQDNLKKLREWFKSLPKYGEFYAGSRYHHSYIERKGLTSSLKLWEMARIYKEDAFFIFDTEGRRGLDDLYNQPWYRKSPYLVFPILGASGLIESVQTIDAWKNDKKFVKGLPLAGRFYPLFNADSATDKIFACEGFATGLSIFEATNRLTVVCLNCGNLTKGIQGATTYLLNSWRLKETPEEFYKRFIIVADNDLSKAGEEGAVQACKELGCSYVLIPEVGMDANDYHHKYGKKQLSKILKF